MKFFDKLKKNSSTGEEKTQGGGSSFVDPLYDINEPEDENTEVVEESEKAAVETNNSEKIEYTPDQDDIIGDIFVELMDEAKADGEDVEEPTAPCEDEPCEDAIESFVAEAQELDNTEEEEPYNEALNAQFIDSLFADAVDNDDVAQEESAELDSAIEALLAEAVEKESVAVSVTAQDNEERSSGEDVVLDDEDVLLMTALGYGSANDAQYAQKKHTESVATPKYTNLERAFAFDGHEYRSKENEGAIKEAYAKESLVMFVRAVGTLFFTVLLLVFDLFGKSFGGFFDPVLYPTTHILMSFQLLLLASALSYKQLWDGLKGIIQVDPRPYSMASLAVLLTMVYNLTLAIIGQTGFALYNFPAAFALVLCVGYDYLVLERELATFKRVSSWDGICTLEKIDSASLASEMGDKSVGASSVGRAFRLRRGSAPDNYFHRLNRRNPADKIYNYIIAPVLALAMVIFIVSLAANRGFVQSFNIFITVIQMGLPSFMAISAILPFFALSRFGFGKDIAVLSEADMADYSEIDTVVFDEKDAFGDGSLNISRIALCDGGKACDMYSVIEDVSAVFDKIGGAFADSFGNEKTDDASAVIIDSVVHRGVKATVGAKKYTIGSDEYLAQCGILVSGYSDKSFTESVAGGVVLHVALEGVEILKLYVTYSIEPAFAEMAKQLSARGIKTVLRSTDPYIDEDLLANLIGELENPIRVIKTAESDSEAVNTDTVDGSLLANDLDWTALLKVKDAGESLNKWTKLNAMIGLGLLAAGVLIASFLGALGASVGLSPLYVVLFQLIAILPSAVISKLLLD
jgi:hypothetical protein